MNGRGSGPKAPGPSADRGWRPAWGWLAVAAGVVAGGALAHWWLAPRAPAEAAAPASAVVAAAGSAPAAAPLPAAAASSSAQAAPPRPAAAPAPSGPPPVPAPRIPRQRDPGGDQSPDIADHINEGKVPTMGEVIDRLHRAGVHTGLGAFQPPGTRPPLVGLAVPEGFELPPGYVRHYQATDDGQRIEPILMFSPDYALFDAAGKPIPLPKDRVVPPELAPPGLPIRRIVIPAPTEPGR